MTSPTCASQMRSPRAAFASDLVLLHKALTEQINGLRRTADFHHQSVVGHGTLIGEHATRITRVERQLGFDSVAH